MVLYYVTGQLFPCLIITQCIYIFPCTCNLVAFYTSVSNLRCRTSKKKRYKILHACILLSDYTSHPFYYINQQAFATTSPYSVSTRPYIPAVNVKNTFILRVVVSLKIMLTLKNAGNEEVHKELTK